MSDRNSPPAKAPQKVATEGVVRPATVTSVPQVYVYRAEQPVSLTAPAENMRPIADATDKTAIRTNYRLQGGGTPHTMTVAELRTLLNDLPDHLPVVMLSPRYGGFGSEMPYGIVAAEETIMHRMERVIPASEYEDDETGEMVRIEEETQVWPAWRGVILQGK